MDRTTFLDPIVGRARWSTGPGYREARRRRESCEIRHARSESIVIRFRARTRRH